MPSAASPRRPFARFSAAAAAAVLLISGCTLTGGEADPSAPTGEDQAQDEGQSTGGSDLPLAELGTSAAQELPGDPATDADYSSYYEQEIQWGECEDVDLTGAECGTLTVPMVWNDPSAGDLEIAVARVQGSGQDTRPLVLNPGGPGGSGVNFLESSPYLFSQEIREGFDLVGFDPRGVGRSAGIECLSDEEIDQFRAETLEPGSAEAEESAEEWSTRIAESCEANSGEILPYLDTYSAARDMDVLRAALGSEQLDYFGFSYGTYLGSTYADVYPERVGRFVLDGAIDPTITMNELSAGQAEGFEKATAAFVEACLEATDSCPLKGDAAEAGEQLRAFLDSVDASPLDSGDPQRPLTGALARSALLILMYSDESWQFGRDALTAAMNGDGSQLLSIADQSAERQLDGSYRTNSTSAITAVNCLDHPGVTDEKWLEQESERLAEEFPTFGASMGGDGCAQWPVPPLREPAPIAAEGAGPIVVIGTTGDPATPYRWSQGLAEQLDSASLLTFDGEGHTAYGRSGGCIEEQVDAYLLEGTVPEDGFTC